MSSIWSALQGVDARRLAAHVFPGFLLYVGILIAIDTITESEYKITISILSDPLSNIDNIASLILVGLFVGTILGMVIDGIGHFVFEETIFRRINTLLDKQEENAYRYWMIEHGIVDHNNKPSPDDLYLVADTDDKGQHTGKIEESLIREYYSFFEFYLNSAIAIFFVSMVTPVYMQRVLEISEQVASIGAIIGLGFSSFLLIVAYHTFNEYRRKTLSRLESKLRKMKGKSGSEIPTVKQKELPKDGKKRAVELTKRAITNNSRYILFIMILGAVTGVSVWNVYEPIYILPHQPITLDRTSIQFVLNETNNWSGHEVINIKNPENFTISDPEVKFTFPYENVTKSIIVTLHPPDDSQMIIINVEGKELAVSGSSSYYGMIILPDNNEEPDAFIDVSVVIQGKEAN